MLKHFPNINNIWFARAVILATALNLFLNTFVWAADSPLNPALISKGQKLFKTACVICHGPNGDGKGSASASLNPKPRNFRKDAFKFGESYEQILKTIGDGIPNSAMPSWKESLGAEDLQALAAYVKSIRNGLAATPVKAISKKSKGVKNVKN